MTSHPPPTTKRTGDVSTLTGKQVVQAVESITQVKPKNLDTSYMVRTGLTLNNYPVEVVEDRDRQIAADLARKLLAFSLQGQVDEADVTVIAVDGKAIDPEISMASIDDTTCLNNTLFVDVALKPSTATAEGANALMDALDSLPSRGLKKVVKRVADPQQSGTKWSSTIRDYITSVCGVWGCGGAMSAVWMIVFSNMIVWCMCGVFCKHDLMMMYPNGIHLGSPHLQLPGRIGTTSVMALRQSVLLPNDCKLRPTELRAELENSFSNNDFVDTLDNGKMNVCVFCCDRCICWCV